MATVRRSLQHRAHKRFDRAAPMVGRTRCVMHGRAQHTQRRITQSLTDRGV
ncbi:Uncharacterised protein [Mycobacteroides abscessus subsp. abscessus]|nr:Uncharacterised protein [Mycobacteroides abscessus subsp. abscessus]